MGSTHEVGRSGQHGSLLIQKPTKCSVNSFFFWGDPFGHSYWLLVDLTYSYDFSRAINTESQQWCGFRWIRETKLEMLKLISITWGGVLRQRHSMHGSQNHLELGSALKLHLMLLQTSHGLKRTEEISGGTLIHYDTETSWADSWSPTGSQQHWSRPWHIKGLTSGTSVQVLILSPLRYSVASCWSPHLQYFLFLTDTCAREIS